MGKYLLGSVLVLVLSSTSHAYDQLPGDKYFSIDEKPVSTSDISPFGFFSEVTVDILASLSLLKWVEHDSVPPIPKEKYVRAHHFGTWMDNTHDTTCFNTRGLVLIRDSKVPTEVMPANRCFIGKGLWNDPYTNNSFTDAKDIQIDHMVPLKEAYVAGASDWDWKKRCAYANFMGNAYHLMSVDGKANNAKSDKGPDQWLPPNRAFACEYVGNWLHIKAIWKLMMSAQEVQAIADTIKTNHCDPKFYVMTEKIGRAHV